MKWLALIPFVVQFYSVGGLFVTVAAGTRFLYDAKSWWPSVMTVALLGAGIDTTVRLWLWSGDCVWDEHLGFALLDLSVLGTILLAVAARLLALLRMRAFPRVALCLAIDFILRLGVGFVWILLQFMYNPQCMK